MADMTRKDCLKCPRHKFCNPFDIVERCAKCGARAFVKISPLGENLEFYFPNNGVPTGITLCRGCYEKEQNEKETSVSAQAR